MSDEVQVQSTEQDAETTQPDVELESSTSEAEQEGGEQASQEEQGAKDPKDWAIKRINELTRQKHDASREAQEARQAAERYRMLAEQLQRGEEPADVVQGPKEEPDIEKLVSERAAQQARQQAAQQRGQEVAKAGGAEYGDFTSAVQTLDALGITQDAVESILAMDDAHKVLYTLGKNPDEAARILSLSPLQQGRELERLALRANNPAAKAVSKAPPPVKPVDSTATAEKDPAKMSMDEWAKWRNQQARIRR